VIRYYTNDKIVRLIVYNFRKQLELFSLNIIHLIMACYVVLKDPILKNQHDPF